MGLQEYQHHPRKKREWFVGDIWDLWDVGVIRKARRSVQIGDGDVVGIIVVENIVQTLERSSKDIGGKVSYADNGED